MKNQYSPPPDSLVPGSRAWTYLRDSGGDSQEKSVDQQEEVMLDICKENKFNLTINWADRARKGSSTVGRDQFMAMIDASEDKLIRPDVILIWNFARFARNSKESQFYKSKLRMSGIIVHSISDIIPKDDHIGELVEGIIDWMNEEKLRQISRDVKRGLQSLVSKGFTPGKPPRGYVCFKVNIGEKRDHTPRIVSKWVPDPVLSEYAKLAWLLRLEGKSYQELSKATHGKLYTSPNSWNSFFKNKSYLGYYGEIADHHEPLVTQEVFDAVQRLRDAHPLYGNKGHMNHPRRIGNPTILSGFTYCLECGSLMTHSRGNKKRPWHHYICTKKDRHGPGACKSKRVGANNAETQIINVVLNKILTPEYLSEVIEETKKQLDSTVEIQRQITAEKRTLEDLEIGIQRILRSIARTGSQSADDFLKKQEAEKTQTIYKIETLSLQLATAQTEITPEAMKIVIAVWLEKFNKVQEAGAVREIKDWLQHFIYRIELGYNRAKIFYTFPITDIINTRTGNITLPRGGTFFCKNADH